MRSVRETFGEALSKPVKDGGYGVEAGARATAVKVNVDGGAELRHGSTVIASITSCTNTSNPCVMIGAGLVAKKAVERGLHVKPYVKTSMAPGSMVVSEYMEESGLQHYLDELGFEVVGYGCTTCIGNSGPLPDVIVSAIEQGSLVAASVLSGNRNFEGRVHPLTKANFLASPPLVVAYALAGTMEIDLDREPLGQRSEGPARVPARHLADVGRSARRGGAKSSTRSRSATATKTCSRATSNGMPSRAAAPICTRGMRRAPTYGSRRSSTVSKRRRSRSSNITGARVLAWLGDSVTTDHISPAGSISQKSPAAKYLMEHGVQPKDFNSYGARRGNHEVMVRGTFANIRLRNKLVPGSEGTWTKCFLDGSEATIYDTSLKYQSGRRAADRAGGEGIRHPVRRATGPRRGPMLLGVRAVIAESYERIHRSNLVGMGILPLQFIDEADLMALKGDETFDILDLSDALKPGATVRVKATPSDGRRRARIQDAPAHRHAGRNRVLPQRRNLEDGAAEVGFVNHPG